jgi:hypothetical protein
MNHERTPGWSVFKQIFHDHWDRFKQDHPRYDRIYYDELALGQMTCYTFGKPYLPTLLAMKWD